MSNNICDDNITESFCENILTNEDLTELEALYHKVTNEDVDLSEIDCGVLQKFKTLLDCYKKQLSEQSRTSKLWLKYIDYVKILRNYIRAARTGDWNVI